MRCPKCSSEVRLGANFCPACGSDQRQAEPQPPPPPIWPEMIHPLAEPEPFAPGMPRKWLFVGIVAGVLLVCGGLSIVLWTKHSFQSVAPPTPQSLASTPLIDPMTGEPTGLDSSFDTLVDFRGVNSTSGYFKSGPVDSAVVREIQDYFTKKFRNKDPIEVSNPLNGSFYAQNSTQDLFLVIRRDEEHNNHAQGYGSYYLLVRGQGMWSDYAIEPIDALRLAGDLNGDGVQEVLAVSAFTAQGETHIGAAIWSLNGQKLQVVREVIASSADTSDFYEDERAALRSQIADTAYVRTVAGRLEFQTITWVKRQGWNRFRRYDEAAFNREQAELEKKHN